MTGASEEGRWQGEEGCRRCRATGAPWSLRGRRDDAAYVAAVSVARTITAATRLRFRAR